MDSNAAARRQAIEARLNQRARDEKTDANRLRRRLVFDTRLRDLVDLVILLEEELVVAGRVVPVVHHVFESRAMQAVPPEIPDPPPGWAADYARLASDAGLRARTLDEAMTRLRQFWKTASPGSPGRSSR